MAGAIIVIDQPGGAGSGSPGVARNDLWQNKQVNLSCATVNGQYQWDLLDVPPGSGASLVGAGTSTPNFLPDLPGTYRIQLITNGGGPGNVQILIIRVRYNSVGVLQNRGWAPPAVGELASESNYGGNLRGWAEQLEFILADVRTSLLGLEKRSPSPADPADVGKYLQAGAAGTAVWADGPVGPQGEQGEQGEPGPTGPTGPEGPSGGGSNAIGLARFIGITSGAVDSIKTSIATSTSPQTYSGGALNGVIGVGDILPYGRSVTVTTTASPGAYNTSDPIVFNVLGYDDTPHTINVLISHSGNANTYGDLAGVAFKVVSIEVPAMLTGAGSLRFGVGDVMGLPQKVVLGTDGGFSVALLSHTRDGQVGAPGDVLLGGPSATTPFGSMAYASGPSGSDDRILFEVDLT